MQLTYDWSKPKNPEAYRPQSDIGVLNQRTSKKRKQIRERLTAVQEARESKDSHWDALAELQGE